jgi:hypothetical protein
VIDGGIVQLKIIIGQYLLAPVILSWDSQDVADLEEERKENKKDKCTVAAARRAFTNTGEQ